MVEKILVVSIHPDDETLGCGGSLLKYKEEGHNIFCIFVTDGNVHQKKIIPQINVEYGFTKAFNLHFPELELDDISLNILIPAFSKIINEVEPTIVFVPNRCDVHSDHRRVFESLMAVTKTFRFPFIKKILMYEVISETDFAPALPENNFQPNVFIDISKFYDHKLRIYSLFNSEIMDSPYTRSIDTLTAHDRYKGSLINVNYAESFVLLKEIL